MSMHISVHLSQDNVDIGRCVPCDAGETKATQNVNFGFKIGVNFILFASPFWLLMQVSNLSDLSRMHLKMSNLQLRGIFLGVGGIVAIVGGVGTTRISSRMSTHGSAHMFTWMFGTYVYTNVDGQVHTTGKLPESWLTSLLKMVLGSLKFLNIDVDATRPGCGGTAATFVPIYWANMNLMLDYMLASLVGIPVLYFLARLLSSLPFTQRKVFFRAVFYDWHNADWYRTRIYCCLVFWLDLSWMILVRNSIQGIIPGLTVDGTLRLYKAPAQRYLKDGHETIFYARHVFTHVHTHACTHICTHICTHVYAHVYTDETTFHTSVGILFFCVIVLPAVLVTFLKREMAGKKARSSVLSPPTPSISVL